MQKSTLVLLLLLVLGMSALVYWSGSQVEAYDEALFPGVERANVVSIRIDNVERDVQVRIDRDDVGGWNLVDPIEAPADEALAGTLLDVLEQDRLRLVPGDPDPEVFGFEPPRIVFRVETRDGQKHSAEIGVVDAAQNSVHVRVRDRIYRGPLRIHTELTRDLNGYRRPYAFRMKPESIGELHRIGASSAGEHRFGYELHAILDNDGWQLISPFSAGLHPGPMSLFVMNGVRTPIRAHLSQFANLDGSGLEPPRSQLTLVELGGARHELRMGDLVGNANVTCRVGESGVAFLTDADSIRRLEIPIELLLDRRVMRASREVLDAIELQRVDQPTLYLMRAEDSWSVAEGDPATGRPADRQRLERLLARLETLLFYDVLEVGALEPDEVHSRLVFSGGGESWELRFGAEYIDEGVACHRVQRAGDDIIGLFEFADSGFLKESLASLRDHRLTQIDELLVSGLVLRANGKERRWNRDDKGRWTREGRDDEAWEILALVDPILNLRAESFEPSAVEATPSLEIEVQFAQGEREELRLAKSESSGVLLLLSNENARLARDQQTLLERLSAVLEAE